MIDDTSTGSRPSFHRMCHIATSADQVGSLMGWFQTRSESLAAALTLSSPTKGGRLPCQLTFASALTRVRIGSEREFARSI